MRTHAHARTHAHTRTHARTRTRTHAHTHTHIIKLCTWYYDIVITVLMWILSMPLTMSVLWSTLNNSHGNKKINNPIIMQIYRSKTLWQLVACCGRHSGAYCLAISVSIDAVVWIPQQNTHCIGCGTHWGWALIIARACYLPPPHPPGSLRQARLMLGVGTVVNYVLKSRGYLLSRTFTRMAARFTWASP